MSSNEMGGVFDRRSVKGQEGLENLPKLEKLGSYIEGHATDVVSAEQLSTYISQEAELVDWDGVQDKGMGAVNFRIDGYTDDRRAEGVLHFNFKSEGGIKRIEIDPAKILELGGKNMTLEVYAKLLSQLESAGFSGKAPYVDYIADQIGPRISLENIVERHREE